MLKFLERTIAWHREVSALAQSPTNPREALLTDALRQSSVQAVRLALDFAQAEAAILELNPARGEKADSARSRNLMQIEATADQRMEALQRQIDQLNRRMQTAPERLRAGLMSQRDVLTAQFNLTKARRDSLHGALGFLNATPGGGLSATIKVSSVPFPSCRRRRSRARRPLSAPPPRRTSTRRRPASSGSLPRS